MEPQSSELTFFGVGTIPLSRWKYRSVLHILLCARCDHIARVKINNKAHFTSALSPTEDQKRKAEGSGRFKQLYKKVKALEEEIILSIKEPDETGETYKTRQGDDAADIVADDENEVSQNEDGTGNSPYLLGCSTTNNPLDWSCYTRSFTCYTEYVLPPDDDKENLPQGITAEGKKVTEPQLDEETLRILGDNPRT